MHIYRTVYTLDSILKTVVMHSQTVATYIQKVYRLQYGLRDVENEFVGKRFARKKIS